MKLFVIVALLVLSTRSAVAQVKQSPALATDEQIALLVTQSERAFDTYESTVELEGTLLSKEAADKDREALRHATDKDREALRQATDKDREALRQATDKDREALRQARTVLGALKRSPQFFNTPMGFVLVSTIDDASRNMALCSAQGGLLASLDLPEGEITQAEGKVSVAQSCLSASVLLYTVSETAFGLYENTLLSLQNLQQRSAEALTKCVALLPHKDGK